MDCKTNNHETKENWRGKIIGEMEEYGDLISGTLSSSGADDFDTLPNKFGRVSKELNFSKETQENKSMERRERILDGSQRIIGYITEDDRGNKKVFDEHNVILGYVNKTGTYNRQMFRVSFYPDAGLLLRKEK